MKLNNLLNTHLILLTKVKCFNFAYYLGFLVNNLAYTHKFIDLIRLNHDK